MNIRSIELEDLRALKVATRAEDAECIAPTHVLEHGRQIVGYGSAGKMGLITGWTSRGIDDEISLRALRRMEAEASMAGVEIIVIGCPDDCRFKPFLEAEGYTAGKVQVTLYFKKAN